MVKYIIEGGIDFYDELYKSLDTPESPKQSEPNKEHCLITNEILEQNHIQLLCKHKFNYKPLYNELIYQKKNVSESIQNNIKCPYCRTIQEFILPQREGYKLIYGINTLNQTYMPPKTYDNTLYSVAKGYQLGVCDYKVVSSVDPIMYVMCGSKYVTPLGNNKCYCSIHKYNGMQLYWNEQKEKTKQKKEQELLLKKQEKEKAKQEKMELKKKEKELKEKEQQEQKEHKKKEKQEQKEKKEQKKGKQEKTQSEETKLEGMKLEGIKSEKENIVTCSQILKTGKRKGEVCGCKVTLETGTICARHMNFEKTK